MNLHIDSFSSGLDEMKRKDQADPVKVLRVLSKFSRFSIFEATENMTIACTMERLMGKECRRLLPDGTRKNYGVLLKITGGQYPWSEFDLTDGGKRLLEDNPA